MRQPGFQAGGLGWRVWLSAFIMSHQMLRCPDIFRGKRVIGVLVSSSSRAAPRPGGLLSAASLAAPQG